MLKLKKIVITGGLACGKSSVTRFFEELGARTVCADKIVHQLLEHDQKIIDKVVSLLGRGVVMNGRIDRKEVAKKVFVNSELLRSLEEILHPAVKKVIEEKYEQCLKDKDCRLFAAEIPLYYESPHLQNDFFEAVLFVEAPEEVARKRFSKGPEEYDRRSSRLIPNQEKRKTADYHIQNDGSLDQLKKEINQIFKQLTR